MALRPIFRIGSQGALYSHYVWVNPILEFGWRQVKQAAGFGQDGLTLDQVLHQCGLALVGPVLDVFVLHVAHRYLQYVGE